MIRVRLKSFISGYLIYLQNIIGVDDEKCPHLVQYKYKVTKKNLEVSMNFAHFS